MWNGAASRSFSSPASVNRAYVTRPSVAHEPFPTPPDQETAVATGTWASDATHSSVGFAVKHMAVGSFKGGFDEFEAKLEDGVLSGVARVASVDVKDEQLNAHLQSPDFFDAERHPEIRFAAQDIRLDGDGKVSVDGELTIKGVTKPVAVTGTVTAPIVDAYGNDRIGLNLTTSVDRTDFAADWNAPL